MRPKIIFTVTNDLSYDQRMIRICNSLVNNGFEVLLIGRLRKNSIPLTTKKFQQHRFNLWFESGKLFYLAYNIRLFFFLLSNRFDIIGSIDLDSLLPCFLASRIKRKSIVFDAHEYFTEVPEVVNRPMTKWVWQALGNWIIPKLKYAYTVSASLQTLFTKKYGVDFQLVRNITKKETLNNTSLNKKSKYTDHPIILYQGVLNEGRGLEEIIKTMQLLPKGELWLAGEGDLSNQLRQLAIDLGLTNRVKFLGYLQPDALKLVTFQATIGLNLLENKGLSYYYSLANKTFDYMYAGIPALHMNFPEYASINEELEIGILVDDLQASTLKKAVLRLITDKDFYQKIENNCQQGTAIFNWAIEETKLVAIYKKAVGLREF